MRSPGGVSIVEGALPWAVWPATGRSCAGFEYLEGLALAGLS